MFERLKKILGIGSNGNKMSSKGASMKFRPPTNNKPDRNKTEPTVQEQEEDDDEFMG